MAKEEIYPNGIPVLKVKRHKWVVSCIIMLLAFILYGNTLSNGYSLDDELVILGNERTELGLDGIGRVWKENYATSQKANYEYRPLSLTTFNIEYAIWGANPRVGHIISILLYGLTGILLYLLLLRLFRDYHWILAFTAVLLFMLHPLHTEVVASIKSRDELMALLFAIAALRTFIRYADTLKWYWLPIGALLFTFSMLSKTSALTFFAIIPLTLYFFTNLSLKKLVIPVVMMFGVLMVARTLFWKPVYAVTHRDALYFENPLFDLDWGFVESIPMGFYSVAYYVKMLFVPYPLTFYYGYDTVEIVGWDSPMAIILGVLLLALAGFAIWGMLKKNKPVWSYGILFFFITISMYANVVKPAVGIVAERFAYIPSIGFSVAIAWVIFKLVNGKISKADKFKNVPIYMIVMFVIAFIFGGIVINRNPDWKDHMTLYQHDIQHAPRSAKAHALIAGTLMPKVQQMKPGIARQNVLDTIEVHFQKAIDIYDGYYTMQNNLGTFYFSFYGDYAKARPYFRKAVYYDPDYVEGHFNLGFSHEKLGQMDSAIIEYKETLRCDSMYRRVWPKLALALVREKRTDEAMEICKAGTRLFPEEPDFNIQVANIYITDGDTINALNYFEKGFKIRPTSVVANHIASLYQQIGDRKKAGEFAGKGIELSNRGQ